MNLDQKQWIRSIFSEADGTGSMTRLLMFVVVVTACALAVYTTLKQGGIPGEGLGMLTTFAATICGVLYGINRADDYLKGNGNAAKS